jgi:hypothetical protein
MSTNNTSWYLSQVISADKADTIRLNYTQVSYYPVSYHLSESKGYLITGQHINNAVDPNTDFLSTTRYTHQIGGYILSDITTRDEKVSFYNSMGRTDIADVNDGMPYKLDSIRYFTVLPGGNIQLLSSTVFNYDYYNPTSPMLYQRLRLLSVSEVGTKGDTGDVYKFHYDGNNNLPARNSFGEDYWGFPNGYSGTTLIPSFTDENGHTFSGADRDPDGLKSIMGLLTSIEYPTGGTTSFEYEAHLYNNHAPGQRDSITLEQSLNVHTGPVTSTTPTFDSVSFYIPYDQPVEIDYSTNARAGEEGDVLVWLVEGVSTQVYPDVWLYTAGALPHSGSSTISLTKGTYTLCIQKQHLMGEYGSANIHYHYHAVSPSVGVLAGGARIKRMVQSDGNSQIIKNFKYLTDSVTSSGKLLSTPVYSGIQNVPAMCTCPAGGQVGNWRYQVYHSMPTADLGRTQGSHICYTHVTVVNGDQGENGREEYDYQYTTDRGSDAYPYAPKGSMDDFRGQLLKRQVYDATGKLVEREENTYNLVANWGYPNFTQIWGVKVGITKKGDISSGGCPFWSPTLGGWDFNVAFYPVLQLWPTLASTKKTLFSTGSNDSIVTVESMGYDTLNLQLSVKKTWLSKGDSLTSYLKYPDGFAGTAVYDTMIARNMLIPVIENDQYHDTSLRSKGIMNYQLWPGTGGTVPLPASTQLQMGNHPMETRLQYLAYDNNSNLLSQSKSADVLHSYIWDYWGHQPVAEVVNASSGDIAYTSFEADGTGGWNVGSISRDTTQGITGARSYNLSNGAISKGSLTSSRTYTVSYWTKNASSFSITGTIAGFPVKGKTINGWTFYIHKVTGQSTITVNGSGAIDELRLYPADAQMTTYTYEPLVGMTSQCNAASQITYYEYDGLQRLRYIRDQDRDILKSYEYRYQAVTSCGSNCSILQMTTLAGTNTLGYPVGVFNVNGQLLGNAATQSQYISLWNADTADAHRGTLAAGADPLHFQFTLIPGKTIPAITGCRYFQMDIAWNNINSIRSCNGDYVDFGDGTGMHLAAHVTDSLAVLAPNTTQTQAAHPEWNGYTWYYIHSYPDNSLKTLTFYHSEQATKISGLDNNGYPASSLPHLRNLRGNLPQYTSNLGGSCYQDSSMSTVAGITNWNTIHSIKSWGHGSGDVGMTPALHLGYAQDFMAGNRDLEAIGLAYPAFIGCFDSTFRISRLKSDWNTYFTHLKSLYISDALWNREDLSGLRELNAIYIIAGREKYTNDPTNNPQIPIPSSALDNIFIQVAAGAGQTVTNGYINLYSGGPDRTAASDAAVATLLAKGWILYLNGIQIH